ncbi:MAG: asparaginase [Anaerolineaceae bacterium]
MNQESGYAPLVELTRGAMVECVHFGAFAVVDAYGKLLCSAGNPNLVTFPRSSMKPFQVLPFVESGGPEHFGLSDEELAIMCASHAGTEAHVDVLRSIHQKTGLQESDLQCGVHYPSDRATSEAMRLRGELPTPYRHNCSGKHSGMLAAARLRGLPTETYLALDHPVQQRIRTVMAEMSGINADALIPGIDGCSAPVYALPLRAFAYAAARLCDPLELTEQRQNACRKITNAMRAHPVMVAGPGKLDTVLMQVLGDKLIAKGGAEGYQMIGLLPDAETGKPGIGIAMKFSDGDPDRRAINSLVTAILCAFGFSDRLENEAYKPFADGVVRNWRGLTAGEKRLSALAAAALADCC